MDNRQFEFEFWMPVRGYEGLYEVSDQGRVRSLNYNHTGQVRVLKPGKNFGYSLVVLCKNRINTMYRVHRLVWEAFNGPIPKNTEIDHINTEPSDNRLSNLRICSHKENMSNPISKAKQTEGARKALNKSVLQLDKTNGEVIRRWECAADASRELGVDFSHISKCCRGVYKSAGGYRWRFAS